jgi:hypothetical protein
MGFSSSTSLITRLLAFIDICANRFPIEFVPVGDFPSYGGSHLNEETIRTADLSRPILLAEIAPGRFNVIDGTKVASRKLAFEDWRKRHDTARFIFFRPTPPW